MAVEQDFVRQFVRDTFQLRPKEKPPAEKKDSVLESIRRRIAGVRKQSGSA
jgi:hypothetical protein